MSKLYCHYCGTEYDSEKNKFCSNCGIPLGQRKRVQKRTPVVNIVIGVVLLIASVLAMSALLSWLFGNCGAIQLYRAVNLLENYADHLYELENATIDNVRPPSYLISQIDGDYSALSNTAFDGCVKPAADAMLASLFRASKFFSELPVNSVGDDGYPIMLSGEILERKYQYEAALREYYAEIEALKACQPFCNINLLFKLPERIFPEFSE